MVFFQVFVGFLWGFLEFESVWLSFFNVCWNVVFSENLVFVDVFDGFYRVVVEFFQGFLEV